MELYLSGVFPAPFKAKMLSIICQTLEEQSFEA